VIGGTDFVLPGKPIRDEAFFVLRALRAEWPQLVVQEADQSVTEPVGSPNLWKRALREFFVYRSAADHASWQQQGATAENGDTMMHVLLTKDGITLVADSTPSSSTARVAAELLVALRAQRAWRSAA
jgi:hypothetical protein